MRSVDRSMEADILFCRDVVAEKTVKTLPRTQLSVLMTIFSANAHVWACPPGDPDWIARGKQEMVAADSEYASKAGLEILEAGGNAIDAAVAVSFALAVTRPYSTGLGGGGFMIARMADGKIIVQDFRETAPAASTADMFVRAKAKNPDGPSPSEFGFLGVAVPGLVAGRCEALKQWGTLPPAKVLQPAIKLARDGYPVDEDYVRTTKEVLATYEKHSSLKDIGGYVYRVHLNNGKLHQVGENLVQPELARLLERLASDGPDFFYKGQLAHDIVAAMKLHGGVITADDLANYKTKLREPIISTYRDYKLILMPPPSSGGIAIAETLNILETFDVKKLGDLGGPHLQIEAMKHAFADRATWLCDADFCDIPANRLMSKPYAAEIASRIHPDRVSDIKSYGNAIDDSGTSHFNVADRFGNVVASTETINTSFGSLAAIDGWGLILNNEMDDFSADPGQPNAFGLIQSGKNAPAPGKRPLSSMSPTIVLKREKPMLILGASGGPRIISSVLNVLMIQTHSDLIVGRSTSLSSAIASPRPHHQWNPDLVYFDYAPGPQFIEPLQMRGHTIAEKLKTGIVQAIVRDDDEDEWVGASDPRKGGKPAGR